MDCVIHVVDDGEGVLADLVASFADRGHRVEAHHSAERFLERVEWERPGCLVLNLEARGGQALDLLSRVPAGVALRTIVLTRNGDARGAVRAIKAGALDFLEQPVERDELVAAVGEALQQSEQAAASLGEAAMAVARLATLTQAERVVLDRLIAGLTSSEIARELHRSDRTVGNHRQHILQKMGARNTADLIRIISTMRAEQSGR